MTAPKIPTGSELVEQLQAAVEAGVLDKNLSNEAYILTGTMSMKRADLQNLITVAGGRIARNVREASWAQRGVLVVGDTKQHGRTAKMREADRYGVTVITESELVQRIMGS
jgi:NAD-dependent DNA ligase